MALRSKSLSSFVRGALFLGAPLVVTSASRIAVASPQSCAQSAEHVQDLRSDKKLLDAKREALTCAVTECPKAVRADCTTWLEELDKLIPALTLRVKGDDKVLTDMHVTMDGKPYLEKLDGSALPIDPGVHKLAIEAAGFDKFERDVLVAEGEKTHLEEIVLHRPAAAQAAVTPATDAKAASSSADEQSGNASLRYASYGVGSAGIVALGVFTVLEISAQSSYSDFKSQPCAATATCDPVAADHVHGKFVGALVAGGIGVAALGTGVVMFVMSGSSDKEKSASPASKTAWHYGVAPTQSGAAAMVGGTF